MSIAVTLYQNHSDPNVVYKSISSLGSVNCELTAGCTIDNPVLILDIKSNIKNFNYMYIPEFGRYYHCVATILNGNQMQISGYTDVLMSFWNQFKGSQCVAQRSSNQGNPEIEDEMMPFESQPEFIYRRSSFAFTPSSSGGCYILTIGGK